MCWKERSSWCVLLPMAHPRASRWFAVSSLEIHQAADLPSSWERQVWDGSHGADLLRFVSRSQGEVLRWAQLSLNRSRLCRGSGLFLVLKCTVSPGLCREDG